MLPKAMSSYVENIGTQLSCSAVFQETGDYFQNMLLLKNAIHSQAGIGLAANTFLFLVCIFTSFLDHRPKPTDLITCHLALVHMVMLLTMVFLVSPGLFESQNFWNDFKCRMFFYVNNVMRGLSICTTCLLSMLQAITISPSSSRVAKCKHKFTSYFTHVFVFLWSLSLSSRSYLIFYIVASSNMTQTNLLVLSKYCSLSPMNFIIRYLVFTLTTSSDIFFVGIMLLSSAHMVILLFRHQRRSQHLHSTRLSPRASPEKRAAQTILLLVGFFVLMYWMHFIISSFSVLLSAHGPVVQDVQTLVFNIYASASPLVLLSSDKRIINTVKNMQQKLHRFLKT
ncbi:PREDICTED: putative vomeronasal receptor-like protein 4 [Galeopterus variegatus]|uniref:Vomeronasal type-1 receptor n=1 Tax=Galeopterus variegatus TaxID=482537 RepID=A0ABM0S552_GALVR|nr:PREDICTED: putative vomeronasal receptor-like protein 4 [Galeopterus variegatus]